MNRITLTFIGLLITCTTFGQYQGEHIMNIDSLILHQPFNVSYHQISQVSYEGHVYKFNKIGQRVQHSYSGKFKTDTIFEYDTIFRMSGWKASFNSPELNTNAVCNCNYYNNLIVCDTKIIEAVSLHFDTRQMVQVAKKNYVATRISEKSGKITVDSIVYEQGGLSEVVYSFSNIKGDSIVKNMYMTGSISKKYKAQHQIIEQRNKTSYTTFNYDSLNRLSEKLYYEYTYDTIKRIYVNPVLRSKQIYFYPMDAVIETHVFLLNSKHELKKCYEQTLSLSYNELGLINMAKLHLKKKLFTSDFILSEEESELLQQPRKRKVVVQYQ